MINVKEVLEKLNIAANYEHVSGNLSFERMGLCHIEAAVPCLSFVDGERYVKDIISFENLFLATEEICEKHPELSAIVVDKPRIVFYKIHNFLADDKRYARSAFATTVGRDCIISSQACISERNVRIGYNVVIEEFVSIKENTYIGDNTIIRAGSVIGGDGFEYKRSDDQILRVQHIGGVRIKKNVEIACNTCVDKAIFPWDDTILGENCKIDNLVHVGHAVVLGAGTFAVAGVIFGGRVTTGKNVWIGMNAVIRNGLTIGDNAEISMGAVVTKDVPGGTRVTGNFAIEHSLFIEKLKKGI